MNIKMIFKRKPIRIGEQTQRNLNEPNIMINRRYFVIRQNRLRLGHLLALFSTLSIISINMFHVNSDVNKQISMQRRYRRTCYLSSIF